MDTYFERDKDYVPETAENQEQESDQDEGPTLAGLLKLNAQRSAKPSVDQDIKHLFTSNIPGYVQSFLQNLPSEGIAFADQPISRKLKNTASVPLNIGNWPHQLAEYAESRGLPGGQLANKLIPELDPRRYLGLGERQPGDLIGELAAPALIPGLPRNIGKGLANTASDLLSGGITEGKHLANQVGRAINAAGDIAPIIKPIASAPYRARTKYINDNFIGSNVRANQNNLTDAANYLLGQGRADLTRDINDALPRARRGDQKAIFNIQSTLRKVAREQIPKGGVHEDVGSRMHGLSNDILGDLHQYYRDIGHPKASELGEQGHARTARYHKIKPWAIGLGSAGLAYAAVPNWVKHLLGIIK